MKIAMSALLLNLYALSTCGSALAGPQEPEEQEQKVSVEQLTRVLKDVPDSDLRWIRTASEIFRLSLRDANSGNLGDKTFKLQYCARYVSGVRGYHGCHPSHRVNSTSLYESQLHAGNLMVIKEPNDDLDGDGKIGYAIANCDLLKSPENIDEASIHKAVVPREEFVRVIGLAAKKIQYDTIAAQVAQQCPKGDCGFK